MDTWKYFNVTHRQHLFCNPMSQEKFRQLVELVCLKPGERVLDIAMGKAEFIIQLAERYQVGGVGVDISPYCVADAQKKHQERAAEVPLRFLQMPGEAYQPEAGESFELAACIGASWVFGGHFETLKALERMAAPQSWVVVGEPYWLKEPPMAYLEAIGEEKNAFGTHFENAAAGESLGLRLVYTLVSSRDDWDQYEGLQWYAAEAWARQNRRDPDMAEVLSRVRKSKEVYLRWGRETIGWAIYLFRKGGVGEVAG